MQGYLSLVLHAHLPFVRHPEHSRFLEENWLFEAITETYIPLLKILQGWRRDGMETRLTLTMTPTLCFMSGDSLLRERYVRHLDELIELAEKEIHRTHWDKPLNELALMYHNRFLEIRETYLSCQCDLVAAFGKFQELGSLEIITSAATHALLPLLANHPPSIRAQILTARDHYQSCFGRDPRGIWLPECAYADGVETVLREANIRWFITDTHGLLHANPRPRYGVFAPIFTPNGIAAFGRDLDSAKQVWSRHTGYPGDPRYRDFYRDIGFDLDLDYLKPHLAAGENRGFTGIKYHRITGGGFEKQIYNRALALTAAAEHAQHFLETRVNQIQRLAEIMDRPPLVLSPYDAELFGHWWYEGPEFLDYFVRKAYYDQNVFSFVTPEEYLKKFPTNQIAKPGASSWGEEGYWRVWLNEKNEWIYPHLHAAQERMTALVRRFPDPNPLQRRALRQAGRELLLAQSSDWPFILRTGTSPDYARKRVKEHLLRFIALHHQLTRTRVDESWLREVEQRDNIFPEINFRYWK
ncbi:MAG TPA: 1,4-alpha-glucan branching protein domain-containing protein [Verrucomicrobiae bacterium]|nr:1,4-alpha-glucan branching protein domain-containing protein [Verrucomicrobiae bacterium]